MDPSGEGSEAAGARAEHVPARHLSWPRHPARQYHPRRSDLPEPGVSPRNERQDVPHEVYVHIAGIDIVRVNAEDFIVLEDNARTPSGVSYMLENREIMMRLFPDLFARHRVAPVERYPDELLSALRSVAPLSASAEPTVALMAPGVHHSAYYAPSL